MNRDFMKVCRLEEVGDGATRLVVVNGTKVLLAREGDAVYGLSPYCTHDGGELYAEKVVDGELECPRHGARFDIHTGKATRMPAVFGLSTYEVKVENGDVYVEALD